MGKIFDRYLETVAEQCIPHSVLFEVTHKCNLRCRHCYVETNKFNHELSTDQIKMILDQLARNKIFFITFSGGDPFLRSDFIDILKHARKRNFSFKIYSNGTAIHPGQLDEIAALKPMRLELSLYGKDAQSHDAFTMIPGSFDKTINIARKCQEKEIPILLKTVWMTYNVDYLDAMDKLARDIKVPLEGTTTVFQTKTGDDTPTRFRLGHTQRKQVIKTLLLKTYDDDEKLRDYLKEKYPNNFAIEKALNNRPCNLAVSRFRIDPKGDMHPCVSWDKVLGNLLTQDFLEIWQENEFLKEMREVTIKDLAVCKACEYFEYCYRCPAMAHFEDGDVRGKAAQACETAKARYEVINELKQKLNIE